MPKIIKTLDASVYDEKYLEFILFDKSTIHIKKPTQRLAIKMALLPQYLIESDINVAVNALNEVFVDILNNNKEGKVFTLSDISDWNIDLKNALLDIYQEIMIELKNQDF